VGTADEELQFTAELRRARCSTSSPSPIPSAPIKSFQRVVSYGAYDEATFATVDVGAPSHPDHAEILGILHNPVFKDPRMNMQMLLPLLREFVASDDRYEFLYTALSDV
jgi:hypothetical protein